MRQKLAVKQNMLDVVSKRSIAFRWILLSELFFLSKEVLFSVFCRWNLVRRGLSWLFSDMALIEEITKGCLLMECCLTLGRD